MKKIYLTFILITAFKLGTYAQVITATNFTSWTGSKPTGWTGVKSSSSGVVQKDSVNGEVYGKYAAQLVNSGTTHHRLATTAVSVAEGEAYKATMWVKGKGDIRFGIYDNNLTDASGYTFGYHYTTYTSINSSVWTKYTMSITSDTLYNSAEFILSYKITDAASGDLLIDSIAIEKTAADNKTIKEIQYTTSTNGSSDFNGSPVKTGGIVTAFKSGVGYWIQSGQGPWTGIMVYDLTNTVSRGDSVTFNAVVEESYSLTRLKNITGFVKVNSGNTNAAAISVTTADARAEQYEGCLVKETNTDVMDSLNTYGEFSVADFGTTDTLRVDDVIYWIGSGKAKKGTGYTLTGVMHYAYSKWSINPRSATDIEETTGISDNNKTKISIYPNPAHSTLSVKGFNSNATVRIFDVTGKNVMNKTVSVSSNDINVSNLVNGVYVVELNNGSTTEFVKFIKE